MQTSAESRGAEQTPPRPARDATGRWGQEVDPRVDRLARMLCDAFVEYHERYLELTHRASRCFMERDWAGHQQDTKDRLNLHKRLVFNVVDAARLVLAEDDPEARTVWIGARRRYVTLVSERMDLELAETFYNSVTRRLFHIVGIDEELEFLWLGPTKLPSADGTRGEYRTFPADASVADCLREIFQHSPLAPSLNDIDGDAAKVAGRVSTLLEQTWDGHLDAIDMLRSVFYRNKGAYLVGRLRWLNRLAPIVIALVHSEAGVKVDAVLLTETDASRLFGYTRSYFHVLCRRPAAVVGFLKSLLPVKPVAELYTSIGYNQHGKTNLFRALYRHMEHSNTRFERARGARGMVMAVFTLPSFDVVFKLIKDRFAPTKRTTPEDVKRRYKLVFGHDRVGRLVDAQEFTNLSFNRYRFDEELIDELRNDCARTVTITDDEVVLHHAYTERRLYPLNLYLREMSPERARAAAIDYGYAIKDLAAANIFPGDLFPKNFGVTRHGVVVFYDYDELALLGEINFRKMPVSQNYDDEMSDQPWFPVESNDVFPEEFRTYLRSPRVIGEVIQARHADICSVEFWKSMQELHHAGELPDFFPYRQELRFDQS
ncbi:MAG: bifunctional isocitrate dehydrogenase kinase/phosphatase [Acidimicrobiia bacterium]|nr:bifunctional isocitrate dehydrogenase kinase/phosphatase [Acidimicrobiia bacterium]